MDEIRIDDLKVFARHGVFPEENEKGQNFYINAKLEMSLRKAGLTDELGASVSYKLLPWLKASGGYNLLFDNNREEITYNDDMSYNNWRPSYWGVRHRFNVSLTASYKVRRVEFSLRERWQYTYRPEKMIDNFDFDEGEWEDHKVRGKGKNVLRSRLQAEWDIPRCKFDPFASVEFHQSKYLDKTRFIVGVDHTIKKTHDFKLYYRYQLTGSHSSDPNIHMLGLGYTYKF